MHKAGDIGQYPLICQHTQPRDIIHIDVVTVFLFVAEAAFHDGIIEAMMLQNRNIHANAGLRFKISKQTMKGMHERGVEHQDSDAVLFADGGDARLRERRSLQRG
ncbi:hypothetical protein SDC9_100091 [bioreactor metagenome]|uniref:Uncharacterized protein n=1 Tax=bioreactor metagenome TaxID=1076179 RepID=A0A645AUT3_9ZZZZ